MGLMNYLFDKDKIRFSISQSQSLTFMFVFIEQPSTSSEIVEITGEDLDTLQSPPSPYGTTDVLDGNSFCHRHSFY